MRNGPETKYTRRDFLKRTGAVAAGVLLAEAVAPLVPVLDLVAKAQGPAAAPALDARGIAGTPAQLEAADKIMQTYKGAGIKVETPEFGSPTVCIEDFDPETDQADFHTPKLLPGKPEDTTPMDVVEMDSQWYKVDPEGSQITISNPQVNNKGELVITPEEMNQIIPVDAGDMIVVKRRNGKVVAITMARRNPSPPGDEHRDSEPKQPTEGPGAPDPGTPEGEDKGPGSFIPPGRRRMRVTP